MNVKRAKWTKKQIESVEDKEEIVVNHQQQGKNKGKKKDRMRNDAKEMILTPDPSDQSANSFKGKILSLPVNS